MKIFTFECEQLLNRPLEEVFEFFSDARNLEKITPPWLQFEIQTQAPIKMSQGTLIDYRLRLHGIRVSWRSRIDVWDPPSRFIDLQLRGPYRLWRHEHLFEEAHGRTRVSDCVKYAVPGGLLIQKFFVRREVERIFQFRRLKLEEIFA